MSKCVAVALNLLMAISAVSASAQSPLGYLGGGLTKRDAPRDPNAKIVCRTSDYGDDDEKYEMKVTWTPVPGGRARSEVVSTGTASPLNAKPPLVYLASRVQTMSGDPGVPASIRNTLSLTIFTNAGDRFQRSVDFLQGGRKVGSAVLDAGTGAPSGPAVTLTADIPAGVIATRQPFSVSFSGSRIGAVTLNFPPVRNVMAWAKANAPASPFEADGRTLKQRIPASCR